MDKNTSHADICVFFLNTLCMRGDKPVFIQQIFNDFSYRYKDIQTQEYGLGKDIRNEVSPPNKRLGYMNIEGNCVYLKRIPYRIFQIGINHRNTKSFLSKYGRYFIDSYDVEYTAKGFHSKEFYNCMLGIYPSLEQCLKIITDTPEFEGCVAFDRQFAVDYRRRVIYKNNEIVGGLNDNCEIKWAKGKEYLKFLLETGNEKDFSILQ